MTDAQQIRERLAEDGHREQAPDRARVRVVNTCCVTAEAVAKSRKAVRRAARTAEQVYVTGCAAALEGAFDGIGERVTVISARSEQVAGRISTGLGARAALFGGEQLPFARTRAYVKIQDGCSFGCSYCVIPQVRRPQPLANGGRRSGRGPAPGRAGPPRAGADGGQPGCFRDRAAGVDLAGLLEAVAAVPGVERVRLSSIEVNHLSDRLLRMIAATGGVARHLHVPMQSGSDDVLRAMRRRYGVAGFVAKMLRARELVDGVNLTTDVIVGHPSEDEAAFEQTLRAVRAAGATKVHVFPYSPRPGTRDSGDDAVPAADKPTPLAALAPAIGCSGGSPPGGQGRPRERVLVETGDGRGYCDDYTPFIVDGAAVGEMAEVVAVSTGGGVVLGRLRLQS